MEIEIERIRETLIVGVPMERETVDALLADVHAATGTPLRTYDYFIDPDVVADPDNDGTDDGFDPTDLCGYITMVWNYLIFRREAEQINAKEEALMTKIGPLVLETDAEYLI